MTIAFMRVSWPVHVVYHDLYNLVFFCGRIKELEYTTYNFRAKYGNSKIIQRHLHFVILVRINDIDPTTNNSRVFRTIYC